MYHISQVSHSSYTAYDYVPNPFKASHFLTVYNSCEVINVWARGQVLYRPYIAMKVI